MQIEPGQQLMGVLAGATAELQVASQKIQHANQVKVMQQRQLLQALSCFEQQNRYLVYDGPTMEANPVFYVQEGSKCWERNCCPYPDCKPWRMTYHNIPPGAVPSDGAIDPVAMQQHPAFLHIERPMSCTCCCINRPEAIITELPSGRVVGKLRDPFAFCNFTFQIQDPSGQERLKSSTYCCQLGFCPCPGCQVSFPINDSSDDHQVATITKTWMKGECCPLCFKDWDNNVINFGEAANPDYKMLLMTLATFIQMRYFDGRSQ
jgi:hypothetical protein